MASLSMSLSATSLGSKAAAAARPVAGPAARAGAAPLANTRLVTEAKNPKLKTNKVRGGGRGGRGGGGGARTQGRAMGSGTLGAHVPVRGGEPGWGCARSPARGRWGAPQRSPREGFGGATRTYVSHAAW